MIYVDSNVPMYLVGAEHPNKRRVVALTPGLISSRERLVTSAETFQEIVHRYRAVRDRQLLSSAYAALETMVSVTFDVTKTDVDAARDLALEVNGLSARDCLHAAVMRRIGCARIWTYDAGLGSVPGIEQVF